MEEEINDGYSSKKVKDYIQKKLDKKNGIVKEDSLDDLTEKVKELSQKSIEKNKEIDERKMEEAEKYANEYINEVDDELETETEEELYFRTHPITKKMESFATEYFHNGNNVKDAFLAVYQKQPKSIAIERGEKYLSDPRIQSFLATLKRNRKEAERIEKGEVIKSLKNLVIKCEAEDNKTNLLKALDQLSKIGGFYTPETQNNIMLQSNGEIQVTFGGWSPDVPKQNISLTASTTNEQ